MAGNKEFNTNIEVKGKINLKDVPNNTPTGFLVWNSEIKDIAQRTSAQLISDLGLITAVNIAASYYTKTQVDTNIKTAVDNIQIGGRNLLRNSKDEIGGTIEYMGIQIGDLITKYGVSEQEFTMSFDLKSDIAGDFGFYSLGDYSISGTSHHITTEWKRYSHTFKIVFKNGEGNNIDYSIYGNYGTGKYIHARNIKLELGNKATDWTPAPEDQVSDWNTTDVNDFSFIKNKPTTFPPNSHSHTFASITDKPTTIAGYGITDSYVKTQVDTNIKTAVDNIQIGGTNIALDSESVIIPSYGGSTMVHTTNYSVSEWGTTKAVRHQLSGGSNPIRATRSFGLVPLNERRSISFYVKNLGTKAIYFSSNEGGKTYTLAVGELKLVKWENILGYGTGDIQIQVVSSVFTDSFDFAIWRVKVERGTKCTDWSPAFEDQIADWNITDVKNLGYIKNKPTTFPSAAHSHTFASITDKPTTIAGYGITDSFKSLTFVENLDVVSESGIYRQEDPANAYPYSATLNLNSSDGRVQLMMNRGGNGMIYRTSASGTTGTSWTPWITVFDSYNLNPQLFLNKNTDNVVDASTFKISNSISPTFGKFEFISDYPAMTYGDARFIITDESKAEFNDLMIVQDNLYGSNTLSVETYFTNNSKIHFVNTLRGGGSSMMSIYNSNYGLAVDLDEENFLTVTLDTITFGSNINKVNISNNYLTQNRVYELPDKSGEIALLSDIPTIPTGNFVTVDTAQTITGSKTFSESSQVVFNSTEGRYLKIINTSSPTINTIITGTEEKWYSNIWKSGVRRGSGSDSLGYSFEINDTDVLTIQNNGGLKTNTVSIGEVPNKLRIVKSDSQTIGILGADNGYGKLVLGSIQTSAHGLSSNWKAAYDWGDHRTPNNNNYLGADYIGGGTEKPNSTSFGSGRLKLQMLSGENIGSGTSWNDVLFMSSYTGTDVKGSNALVFGKNNEKVGFMRQDYDSANWGTYREIYHSGNLTNKNYLDTINQNLGTSNTPTFNGVTVGANGGVSSINSFPIYNGSNAQKILTGGILASEIFTDESKIPTNGIYSKGHILTGGRIYTQNAIYSTELSGEQMLLGSGNILYVGNSSVQNYYLETGNTDIYHNKVGGGGVGKIWTEHNLNPTASKWSQSTRDFLDGTLIYTSIDYSQENGSAWLLEIKGNMYNDTSTLDLKVQGYIYANTIINVGGTSTNESFTSIKAMNIAGKLCFWFPRLNYWQGFTVFCSEVQGNGNINTVTSIVNSGEPGGTKVVDIPISILAKQSWANNKFAEKWEGAEAIGFSSGGNPNADNSSYPYFHSIYGYIALATRKWVGDNFDKYNYWNLQTNNVQRTSMPSGSNLNLVAGANVTISYSAGGTVTINAANSGVPANMVTTDTTQTITGIKTFTQSITAPAFYEGSLKSLKKNIKTFEKSGLELVGDLNIVTFDRKDESAKNKIGIIADDSPKEFLSEELNAVDLYKTVFIQAKAIQELTKKLEYMEKLIKNMTDGR